MESLLSALTAFIYVIVFLVFLGGLVFLSRFIGHKEENPTPIPAPEWKSSSRPITAEEFELYRKEGKLPEGFEEQAGTGDYRSTKVVKKTPVKRKPATPAKPTTENLT